MRPKTIGGKLVIDRECNTKRVRLNYRADRAHELNMMPGTIEMLIGSYSE